MLSVQIRLSAPKYLFKMKIIFNIFSFILCLATLLYFNPIIYCSFGFLLASVLFATESEYFDYVIDKFGWFGVFRIFIANICYWPSLFLIKVYLFIKEKL